MDCAKSRRSLPTVTHKTQQCHTDLNLTHDLDLFYIRQIAHHLKEYDLEQKIDVEIRIREGTTKLLAACQHPSQSLEAAKTLRMSNERMTVYMNELQLRKRNQSRSIHSVNSSPSRGKLGLSDLRFPLMWKDTDHFKNRGDYRRFAVFCLAKVGTDVFDTSLITPVDRSAIDITFPDNFVFTGIGHDFTLTLEVYACMLQDDLSIASTPRKLQKSLHSSISKTIGRKLSAAMKDHPPRHESGPRFDLVATATLNLECVHDDIKSHDLILENLENPLFQLPLFGHFCCRLAAQPIVEDHEATVTLKSPRVKFKGNPAEPSLWTVMTGFSLEFYVKKEHKIKGKEPVLVLPINKTTKLEVSKDDTVRISTQDEDHEDVVAELVVEDSGRWTEALRQRIADFLIWHPASVQSMEIHSPAIIRQHNSDWTSRQGSLYDETPLFEEPRVAQRRQRPTVHDVFNLPQDNTLRSEHTSSGSISMRESRSSLQTNSTSPFHSLSRSSSTSNSSGSGSLPSWGSVRGISGMWPFSRRHK